jgi:hypothetical protein
MANILTSAVVAAIVSGLISFFASERRIAAENIIQERTKWRDRVRDLAEQVRKELENRDETTLWLLRAEMTLRLNPHDPNDHQILELIDAKNGSHGNEFTQRVALLLKHDWERARHEANLWLWMCCRYPTRAEFEEFRRGKSHEYWEPRWFIPKWLFRIVWQPQRR